MSGLGIRRIALKRFGKPLVALFVAQLPVKRCASRRFLLDVSVTSVAPPSRPICSAARHVVGAHALPACRCRDKDRIQHHLPAPEGWQGPEEIEMDEAHHCSILPGHQDQAGGSR